MVALFEGVLNYGEGTYLYTAYKPGQEEQWTGLGTRWYYLDPHRADMQTARRVVEIDQVWRRRLDRDFALLEVCLDICQIHFFASCHRV